MKPFVQDAPPLTDVAQPVLSDPPVENRPVWKTASIVHSTSPLVELAGRTVRAAYDARATGSTPRFAGGCYDSCREGRQLAPVAQRIERRPPEPEAQVRVLPGALTECRVG